jgi:hypothetical protein
LFLLWFVAGVVHELIASNDIDVPPGQSVSGRTRIARACNELHEMTRARHYPSAMGERISGRELAIIFAFWTALATLSAVNTLLDPRGYGLRLISPAGPIAMAYAEECPSLPRCWRSGAFAS